MDDGRSHVNPWPPAPPHQEEHTRTNQSNAGHASNHRAGDRPARHTSRVTIAVAAAFTRRGSRPGRCRRGPPRGRRRRETRSGVDGRGPVEARLQRAHRRRGAEVVGRGRDGPVDALEAVLAAPPACIEPVADRVVLPPERPRLVGTLRA